MQLARLAGSGSGPDEPLEFGRLMKEGRQSLAIGLLFLLGCLAVSNALTGQATGAFCNIPGTHPRKWNAPVRTKS
jgi:hypothetical protein